MGFCEQMWNVQTRMSHICLCEQDLTARHAPKDHLRYSRTLCICAALKFGVNAPWFLRTQSLHCIYCLSVILLSLVVTISLLSQSAAGSDRHRGGAVSGAERGFLRSASPLCSVLAASKTKGLDLAAVQTYTWCNLNFAALKLFIDAFEPDSYFLSLREGGHLSVYRYRSKHNPVLYTYLKTTLLQAEESGRFWR